MTKRAVETTTRRGPRKALPPLDYLLALEAAAEYLSFSGASRRLNISETAISRKVRLLERHFGVPFFTRGHRSIGLTPHGRDFLARIGPALDLLRNAADDMLNASLNRPVVLAATNSVASLWLMPRLHVFRQANRNLQIMLISSDNDEECLGDTVDLTILRGDGNWPGYRAQLVFGETIFPVCSPEFLAANPMAAEVDKLPQVSLIEVACSHAEWMNWQTWLAHSDVACDWFEQRTLFNTYPLSIHAAVDGVGIALGWGHLVDGFLESGRLVRPLGARHVRTTHGYYLLTPANRPGFPGRDRVAAWLMGESAARRSYGDDGSIAPPVR